MERQDGITEKELQELKEAFDLFDVNGDAKINLKELGSVLRALGQNPTEETIKEVMEKADKDELKEAFDLFDVNGDAKINLKELGSVLRALGQNPTEETIKEVMEKADKDGNQFLEYSEYVELLKGYLKDPTVVEIELREAFRVFDKDRNNNLNFVELRRALTHLGEPLSDKEAIELCNMMDTDGDKNVDIDEFVKFMCRRL